MAKLVLLAIYLGVACLNLPPLVAAVRSLPSGRLELVARYGIRVRIVRSDRPVRYWLTVAFLTVLHLGLLALLLWFSLLLIAYRGPL